uniref:ACP S-malonyltransferase n=1 Tax=Vaginimicrobium propionicum TaxID=1871034 RepID=UPI002F918659
MSAIIIYMLAIVAPGQGAQTSGFLASWCHLESFRTGLAQLSQNCGLDLVELGTKADNETIKDTAIAQPLLVASALLVYRELNVRPDLVAGHSVGEIAAASMSGVLSELEAMTFVAARGRAMAKAAALTPTGMSAVLAGKPDEIATRLADLNLVAANNNGRGQVVAAGKLDDLAELAANPPARARVIPLRVAGAFHTDYMASAREDLIPLAKTLKPANPTVTLLSNLDGQAVASGSQYLDNLINQVTRCVRWDLCMKQMNELGVTGLLELAPAKTLTGIAKRNMSAEVFNLNTPDQLDAAHDFCARHAA